MSFNCLVQAVLSSKICLERDLPNLDLTSKEDGTMMVSVSWLQGADDRTQS